MISVRVGIKKNEDSNYERLVQELKNLKKYKVHIGVFGSDEYVMIAEVNEFGRMIYVPPTHKKTYHKAYKSGDLKKGFVKKSKSNFVMRSQSKGYYIKIPARPFIRGTFDKRKDEIDKLSKQCIENIVFKEMTAYQAYKILGEELVNLTRDYLTNLSKPANNPSTIKKKGSSNPLIDTGELRKRITYKIIKVGVSE